jgi:hypothetical protein
MSITQKIKNNVILHNRYILYFIFFIALGDLLILLQTNDYYSASIFVLIGFLTSFFSKNMIVILFISIAFTNIIKYGAKSTTESMTKSMMEGMTEGITEDGEDNEKEKEKEGMDTDLVSNEMNHEETDLDVIPKETKKPAKKEGLEKKEKTTPKNTKPSELSVETNEETNKEKFGEDKNIVYTSEEEKELAKTEKMILSQERILKSMNKYKPLLDTLQGITKNMAVVKGAASLANE